MPAPPPLPEDALLSLAALQSRHGSVVVTYANRAYLPVVLNWLIALDRIEVGNVLVVTLDQHIQDFLHQRGFPVVLVDTRNDLQDIWLTRVRVSRMLVCNGFSVIQSDADAVWLRDPRDAFFDPRQTSMVISQGVDWPRIAYDAWGFVLCTGLFSMRCEAATMTLLDRWHRDLQETGSDQASLNRLLLSDGVQWDTAAVNRQVWRFKNLDFTSFDGVVSGLCPAAGVSLRLLPHTLFQRVPVETSDPYVVHYLPDRARLPETQALTQTGSWFLADNWRQIDFDVETLHRIAVWRHLEPAKNTYPGRHQRSNGLCTHGRLKPGASPCQPGSTA